MTDSTLHAVLTGDLIKSRQATPAAVDAAFAVLDNAAADFGKVCGTDLRFTRYRGDGWQIVLTDPHLMLDAVLFFTASLRAGQPGIATRMSIGIGPIETPGTRDLSDATGPAFFTSGDQLDSMSRKRTIALAGQGIGPALVAILDLTEFITAGWTAAQAEAVAHALQGQSRTHDAIAAELGITRQAVQSRLAGAGFSYFETALYAIRNHDFTTPPQD